MDIGAQQTEIRRLAYWDRLTGLPNRERFRDAVVQAIAASASTPQPLAVLTLDLDRFKHVNDVLGYAFGDRLLQAVAERLSQQVRSPDDMVARLGGNEFAILLQRADAADAHDVAQRINQSFEQPLAFEDQTVDRRNVLHNSLQSVIARSRAIRCVAFLAHSPAMGCKKTPCGLSRSALPPTREGYAGHP